jgi:hypothetical protein
MIKTTPAVQPGHIYNKSETARLLGISRVTLRKYTNLHRIEICLHPLNGMEYYTAEAILNAWEARVGQRMEVSSSADIAVGRMRVDGQRSSSFNVHINSYRKHD